MNPRNPRVNPATAITGLIVLVACLIVVLAQGDGDRPYPDAPGPGPTLTSETPTYDMADPSLPRPPDMTAPAGPTGSVAVSSTPPPAMVDPDTDVDLEREDDHHPPPRTAGDQPAEGDPEDDARDSDRGHARWWRWLT